MEWSQRTGIRNNIREREKEGRPYQHMAGHSAVNSPVLASQGEPFRMQYAKL